MCCSSLGWPISRSYRRWLEPIPIDQMVRDGATDHAGGYQAKRAGSNADLRGISDPMLIGENWRPSDCRAQATCEGYGPRH